MTETPISIVRGRGGEVEAEGPIDSLASELLTRAGFIHQYTLSGTWRRLPFDMGEEWENTHASHAAEMLRAARYPVQLDPSLSPTAPPREAVGDGAPRSVQAAAQTLKTWAQNTGDLRQPYEAGRTLAALAQGDDSLLRSVADLLLGTASAVSALPGHAHDRDARRLAELAGVLRVVEIEVDRIALGLQATPDLAPTAAQQRSRAVVEAPPKLQALVHRLSEQRAREYEAHLRRPAAPAPSGGGRGR
ncbi:hypothetical protein BJP40_03820 [Streptomyces sp. CC53]|uniref:hypothetical protein n=1 Tax=Streptomyces sp. CC53 TaxID=1906740 RepID=UPI0008DCBCE4|nr:hypothetical protein [Streptomyces sp. CC53]OII62141.1 hypothetical protein BJP40_03820 [Streptomyces sp. CC53]